jgi:hypothetical protein
LNTLLEKNRCGIVDAYECLSRTKFYRLSFDEVEKQDQGRFRLICDHLKARADYIQGSMGTANVSPVEDIGGCGDELMEGSLLGSGSLGLRDSSEKSYCQYQNLVFEKCSSAYRMVPKTLLVPRSLPSAGSPPSARAIMFWVFAKVGARYAMPVPQGA